MAKEMIMVIFNSSIEEEMVEALKGAGMECFTKIPGVHGSGEESEPRLDSHVWPGTNTMLMICADETNKGPLLGAVRHLEERHRTEGVRAFVIPVSEII
jgi:nitrogen regulatory protein PII